MNSRFAILLFALISLLFQSCNKPVTPPPDLPKHAIIAYGDSRDGHRRHRKLVKAMLEAEPDVVIHTGDFVTHSDDKEEWATALEIMKPLMDHSLFLPARGNHEKSAAQFVDYFKIRGGHSWYSIDHDSVHYIVIDSEKDQWKDSTQYKWIEHDLQSQPENTLLTIAIMHIPLYTSGKWEPSGNLRRKIEPLFLQYGVDLVIQGHNHSYERIEKDGITYIITGGGGAQLYDQGNRKQQVERFYKGIHFCLIVRNGKHLTGRVYTPEFMEIDNFTVDGD